MLLTSLMALSLAAPQHVNHHGTIALTPGVAVMRAGSTLSGGSKAITLAEGDTVSNGSGEKVSVIAPDNSVVWMMPHSSLVVSSWGAREEYHLTKGSFRVFSCPHGPPPGTRAVSLRTCCIRMWWPDQAGDLNFDVTVVGHEKCLIERKSGILYRQKNVGDRAVGPITRLG